MDFFSNSNVIYELTPNDFDKNKTYKLTDKQCSVILFYCDWCPHCRNVKDTWEELGKLAGFMKVCSFNCEKYKGHIMKMNEERPLVKGYPTILFYRGGEPVKKFEGERTKQNLLKECMNMCQRKK